MTKLDLITGFLGAGKTTFLKYYINHYLSKGERICILEFDHGAINVDTMLLQEFSNKCDLEMVAGGCDQECHLRRFKTKLIAMGMRKYDRVIIEPSGLFDLDEFFDTYYDVEDWYDIGSIIAVVDPLMNFNLSKNSEYIFVNELMNAGSIVLSKQDSCSAKQNKTAKDNIERILNKYSFNINNYCCFTKKYDDFIDEDYDTITRNGYKQNSIPKLFNVENGDYQTLYFMNQKLTLENINKIVGELFANNKFGNVIRVKGFINEEGKWYSINISATDKKIETVSTGQDVIIVIGEDLKNDEIDFLFKQNK